MGRKGFALALLLLCAALSVSAQASDRLVLSYVRSDQVRLDNGVAMPLVVQWGFSATQRVGSTSVGSVERANSFIILEEYLFDWVLFDLGRQLTFSASIGGSSPFALGSSVLSHAELVSAQQQVVHLALPGGALGLRLVPASFPADVAALPALSLAVASAQVRNAGGVTQTFPRFALRCAASGAASVNASARPFPVAMRTRTSLEGAVTRFGVTQKVDRPVGQWRPAQSGAVLVCGVVQEDGEGFFEAGELGLGVVSLDAARLAALPSSSGVALSTAAFDLVMGRCGCDSPSKAAALAAAPFGLLLLAALAALTMTA